MISHLIAIVTIPYIFEAIEHLLDSYKLLLWILVSSTIINHHIKQAWCLFLFAHQLKQVLCLNLFSGLQLISLKIVFKDPDILSGEECHKITVIIRLGHALDPVL